MVLSPSYLSDSECSHFTIVHFARKQSTRIKQFSKSLFLMRYAKEWPSRCLTLRNQVPYWLGASGLRESNHYVGHSDWFKQLYFCSCYLICHRWIWNVRQFQGVCIWQHHQRVIDPNDRYCWYLINQFFRLRIYRSQDDHSRQLHAMTSAHPHLFEKNKYLSNRVTWFHLNCLPHTNVLST